MEKFCIVCGQETVFSKVLGKVEASFCPEHFPVTIGRTSVRQVGSEEKRKIVCYV